MVRWTSNHLLSSYHIDMRIQRCDQHEFNWEGFIRAAQDPREPTNRQTGQNNTPERERERWMRTRIWISRTHRDATLISSVCIIISAPGRCRIFSGCVCVLHWLQIGQCTHKRTHTHTQCDKDVCSHGDCCHGRTPLLALLPWRRSASRPLTPVSSGRKSFNEGIFWVSPYQIHRWQTSQHYNNHCIWNICSYVILIQLRLQLHLTNTQYLLI